MFALGASQPTHIWTEKQSNSDFQVVPAFPFAFPDLDSSSDEDSRRWEHSATAAGFQSTGRREKMLFVLHLHLDKTSHFPKLLLSQLPCFSPGPLAVGKASPRTAHPELSVSQCNGICHPAGLTPPFGGEIKDLLHNEPWDCPLPGSEAALVSSSPSFSSICWVWMLRLGACEFPCACLELTHHRLGFGFCLPDQFSSFTPRFCFSHTTLAMLKQFLWCSSNLSCSIQVFSLPVLPVQLCVLGVLVVVWCCGGGCQAGGAPCPVGMRDSDGRLLPPPCQV